MTALGADSVVMHPMGMLGPTDPTVANPFNPPDPNNPNQRIGISVEDVTASIALTKEDAGIQHEDELVQAFNKLADQMHPLALGNVKRSLSQSRLMAKKLVSLHMDVSKEEHKINEIVDSLTSKLFFHGHPINRREAKEQVGLLTVADSCPKVEELMWELYCFVRLNSTLLTIPDSGAIPSSKLDSGETKWRWIPVWKRVSPRRPTPEKAKFNLTEHYLEYEREIKMEEPFQPVMEFVAQFPNLQPNQGQITPVTTAKLAFIESTKRTDVFSLDYQIVGQKAQNGVTSVTIIHSRQGWLTE